MLFPPPGGPVQDWFHGLAAKSKLILQSPAHVFLESLPQNTHTHNVSRCQSIVIMFLLQYTSHFMDCLKINLLIQ